MPTPEGSISTSAIWTGQQEEPAVEETVEEVVEETEKESE